MRPNVNSMVGGKLCTMGTISVPFFMMGAYCTNIFSRSFLPGEPEGYDIVVVGSGIKMGKWITEALNYLKDNEESLSLQPAPRADGRGSIAS